MVNGRTAVAVLAAAGVAFGALAPAASAQKLDTLNGFRAPGTPSKYNKVGVLKFGKTRARNVLVLNPGTSASAAYFAPLAKTLVRQAPDWQVWAVERRENLLEDHSRRSTRSSGDGDGAKELFDYYLVRSTDPSITNHFRLIPDSEVGYARDWGMRVEVEDLRRVVRSAKQARRQGRRRRPLARRLDHDRLCDLGLRRAAGRPRAGRSRCSSTAAARRRR